LSNHFSNKHGDSQIRFSYGDFFVVSMMSNDETIVLQEQNDEKLFILNKSTMTFGNVVNICCIGPNLPESEYSYDILARTPKCKLRLQSFATNVKQFTLTTFSSNFLMIPSDSSKPLKLQICINPCMVHPISFGLVWFFPPIKVLLFSFIFWLCNLAFYLKFLVQIQIFIRGLDGNTISASFRSSDKVVNVKLEILYRQSIPVQHQRLIFNGMQLDDNMTLAHYNIKAESTLHLALRLIGN
jgi:hypothetical protein